MIENITSQIKGFLSALKTTYDQQGQLGKILLPSVFLLAFCCCCSVLASMLPSRGSPTPVPSPNLFPTLAGQPTPTPLFQFEFPTSTPFPTFPPPTAFP